jgi:hypothetical protein
MGDEIHESPDPLRMDGEVVTLGAAADRAALVAQRLGEEGRGVFREPAPPFAVERSRHAGHPVAVDRVA